MRADGWELFADLVLTKSFPAGIRRVREHRLERSTGDEHLRRVEDVLAGGAEMHVGGEVLADRFAQGPHQRHDRRGVAAGVATDREHVDVVGAALRRDRLGSLDRH